jgi:hypothetical protein
MRQKKSLRIEKPDLDKKIALRGRTELAPSLSLSEQESVGFLSYFDLF